MSIPVSRAMLLLASMDLRDRDIHRLGKWIELNGAAALVQRIMDLRAHADMDGGPPYLRAVSDARYSSEAIADEIITKIERLLFDEARLTRSEASELIRDRLLRKRNIAAPELQRSSFRSWINKIADFVPESEILHLATSIRNQRVHSDKTDWPLSSK